MKKLLSAIALLCVTSSALAGNHGPCKVVELTQSDSYENYMVVKLSCDGTSLPAPNTANCGSTVAQDTLAFDATTTIGQLRASMLMSAHATQKDVQITSWGACLTQVNFAPQLYGIIMK